MKTGHIILLFFLVLSIGALLATSGNSSDGEENNVERHPLSQDQNLEINKRAPATKILAPSLPGVTQQAFSILFRYHKIAFSSERDGNPEIYVMNAGGSGQTRLTNNPAWDISPSWSPDGTKIAFESNRDGNHEIYVMDADGSRQTRLTNHPSFGIHPSWSPDGTKIAFDSYRDDNYEIYVMDADGSRQTRLTNNPVTDGYPSWSPDGTKIAFMSFGDYNPEIYVMDADGSGQTRLTYNRSIDGSDSTDTSPSWSPDGTKIAFGSFRDGNNEDIYVMNADGSGQTRLTNNPARDSSPSWSH